MAEPDAVMPRIAQGIELGRRGDRGAARAAFREIWEEIGESGDALYRCSLAHSMADVQDDLNEELVWDLRALEAADAVTDERARRAGMVGPVHGWYPSLHLNLGDVYRRLGDLGKAREHLAHGQAAADALAHDGYGQMISAGLDRLAERLVRGGLDLTRCRWSRPGVLVWFTRRQPGGSSRTSGRPTRRSGSGGL